MKLTNKKTGNSFNLSGKGAADFFYAKMLMESTSTKQKTTL